MSDERGRRHAYRTSWSPSEDDALMYVMRNTNPTSWDDVSTQVAVIAGKPVRDPGQVNQHWRRVVFPKINPGERASDELLMLHYAIYGNKWSEIAKMCDGLSDVQVKYKIEKLKREGRIKGRDGQ